MLIPVYINSCHHIEISDLLCFHGTEPVSEIKCKHETISEKWTIETKGIKDIQSLKYMSLKEALWSH